MEEKCNMNSEWKAASTHNVLSIKLKRKHQGHEKLK